MPNSTVPAADEGLPEYDIDDVAYDAADLYRLLDVISDELSGISHVTCDGGRHHKLDRVGSLIKIAAGAAASIRDKAEREA